MDALIDIKPGDSVVLRSRWNTSVVVASRVTALMFFYKEPSRRDASRETRVARDGVVFAGAADIAIRLSEQLNSSRAQQNAEERTAYERRIRRDAEFIAKAEASK